MLGWAGRITWAFRERNGLTSRHSYLAPCEDLSFSERYYVLLRPLPAGHHTIHIACGFGLPLFLDVYYNLTVPGSGEDEHCERR
jgi:hypothetical protein